ncbi:TonB-dependent receptor [Zavarzinia compransoris]|uniref:TonB-dependent receptor n=1 Tax=Zavarzinia compransoris TaxID=1264899 RepID=A0A317E3Y1_9PROT|nr:TonB-dependent receptor [Zavarzinia compransoris]PWR20920.1 TonB-dependent receptor [Zavarzinia compransoris]TDP44242.1 TonB-dependent receptor [Zavarzinia compransoris]
MRKRQAVSRLAGITFCTLAPVLPALAQDAVPGATEHVNVIGQAASIGEALSEQRRSDAIESVVHADGVAQLPDENAAEALQRLPGVSVERDQGEGRFVSVRGLGPDLNAVTINGTLLPSPSGDSRAVGLDVLPSELIQSLTVVKTATPDMDANSLGGTIEIESLSAFDHQGLFYTGSAEGSYDSNTDRYSPKFSGAFSDRFDLGGAGEFGIAIAASWQERDFGSDNVETGDAWDFEDGARLEETSQRDYLITRERAGFGVNLDYRPSTVTSLYLRTLYSHYKDSETRNALGVEFADPLLPGETGEGEGFRELKDREETQEIQSYVAGGEHMAGAWTVSGQAGYSESSEKTPGGIGGAVFEGNDDFAGLSFRSGRKPVLNAGPDFYDPANFSLSEIEYTDDAATDREWNIRLDIANEHDLGGFAGTFKFGAKLSRREKENGSDAWIFEDFGDYGFSDDDLLLGNFTGRRPDSTLGSFGPGIGADALRSLIGRLDRDEFFDEEESRVNDFTIEEDINAAYVMETVDIGGLRVIAGLRYEGTEMTATGTGLRDDDFEAISVSNDYEHWLPSLNLRYRLGRDAQLRAAVTRSVVRPSFEQLAPGFVIDGDEAAFGNPNLKPLESTNLDFGIEYYIDRTSAISVYAFYKDIENFAYATDVAGTGAWVGFDEAETFANGDRARVYGLELAYTQKFSMLPEPFNGLLIGANVTISDSDASISGQDGRRDIDLPNQSKLVGNLTLGWENDDISLRLSANHKSRYLVEVGPIDDPLHDLRADAQTFLDFSARYTVMDGVQLTFEAQNLTDQAFYTYAGDRAFNAQYEEYGPTFKLGLTVSSF